MKKAKWLKKRISELLPVGYFHNVFTLPHELNPIALCNKKEIFDILFRSVAETLKEFGGNPQNGLGGKLGFIAILHTWDQTLLDHFHIHVVIPAGALSPDNSRWISARKPRRKDFLFHVKALSEVFRGKFIHYLKLAFSSGKLSFPGKISRLNTKRAFFSLIGQLWEKKWVVYSKEPFAGPEQVLDYLGRYTHRVAISNNRITSVEDGKVSFKYRDRKDGDNVKVMKIDVFEFIRRFLLHVLPEGFMRIRHYGILANRCKSKDIRRCRKLLGLPPEPREPAEKNIRELMLELTGTDISKCPECGKGTMKIVKELPAAMAILMEESQLKLVKPETLDSS
jgi:hypothetical protein